MRNSFKYIQRFTLVNTIILSLFQCTSKKSNTDNSQSRTPVQTVGETNADFAYVFKGGEEGYKCYRIPAVVVTTKGTILAFAEGRKGGCSDTGNIDLLVKRSLDGGKTWSDPILVWDDGGNTCGNPAPVVDRETGDILLLSTWNLGEDHESEILSGQSTDTRRVFVLSSGDDGKTWSDAREITRDVKLPEWNWYATGPGSGIQLQNSSYKGRLVIPCDYIEKDKKRAGSHVIYSDDHGNTWQLGGIAPHDQVNESTVAELPDGALMLNMRNYDKEEVFRKVAISKDGGATWSEVYSDSTLVEPICQGSLISHRFSDDGTHYLAFSNPASKGKRVNMTVRLSADNGKTWPVEKTIHEGPSAYSNLVSISGGALGLYYEGGLKRPYEGLAFEIIPAEALNIAQ